MFSIYDDIYLNLKSIVDKPAVKLVTILFWLLIFKILIVKIVILLWTNFLAKWLGRGVKWNVVPNSWAIITGATDGIGLQYAKQLAAKGYSLLIISRSQNKLNLVAAKLMDDNPDCKQIKTLAIDLSRRNIYGKINEELETLETIDVLVNNVGTAYSHAEYFTRIPKLYNEMYFNVNMLAATQMMALVLPRMEFQRRGIIINVSSQAAHHPLPLMSVYSASKAYLSSLSQGLSVEYASKGIIIQTVVPNQVKTKMTNNFLKIPFFAVTADAYVRAAIKTVGIESTTSGHWKHKLFNTIQNIESLLFGENFMMKVTFYLLNRNRNVYYKTHNLYEA